MATRFYFSSTATPPSSPGFEAWTRTTEGVRRKMSPVKDASALTSFSFWANTAAAANATCLCVQLSSPILKTGTSFTTAQTFKCQIRCQESATNDNINRQPIAVKIYNGTTLQVTLKALGHIGPNTTEWLSTGLRNKTLADGDAFTSNYTTVAGDYLVVEAGGQVDGTGGTTVTGTMDIGAPTSGADLGENETDVTSTLLPWFETSVTLNFAWTATTTDAPQTSESIGTVKSLFRTCTDAPTVAESLARVVTAPRTATGTLTVAESMTRIETLIRAAVDAPTLAESVARTASLLRVVTDAPTASESMGTIKSLVRPATSAPTLSEAVVAIGSGGGGSFPLPGWGKRKPITYDTVFPQSNQADFPMWFNIAGDTDIASELSGGGGIAVTEADGTTLVPFGLYPSANLASGDVFMRAKFTLANEVPFLAGWGKRKAVKYATVFPDSNLTSFPQWFDIQGDTDIAAGVYGLFYRLESYWKLEEASGDAIDAYGSNDLTDNNTVGSGTGIIGNARDFESGNLESLSHTDNASLSSGDINLTLSVWVKLESKSGNMQIMFKGGGSNGEYFLYYKASTDRFVFDVYGAVAYGSSGSVSADNFGSPSTGIWYHIVAWHDADNNKLGISINAGTPDLATHSAGIYNSTEVFGISGVAGEYFDGLIDEAGLWKTVLTAAQRTQLYNAGAGFSIDDWEGPGGITVTLADGETEVPFGLYPSANLASGDVPIRVKMDPLTAASTGDVMLYIYYDAGQTTVEDKAGTVSNGYVLFMPLEEDPSGSAPQMFDWVTETYVGTSSGSMTSGDLVAGEVADGLDFDGSNDQINVPNTGQFDLTEATLEIIVKADSLPNYALPCGPVDNNGSQYELWYNTNDFSPNNVMVFASNGYNDLTRRATVAFTDTTSFHHFAGVLNDGGINKIYLDGSPGTSSSATGYNPVASFDFKVGLGSGWTDWDGILDEVKGSNVARSADWIDWTYKNEFDNANTFSLGDEEVNAGEAADTGVVFGYLYYDAAKTTTQDKAGTVDNGYVLFMPMEEDPSGGAPQMFDWVTESNIGTSGGGMTSGDLVAGQVASGLDFDGSNDKITIADKPSLDLTSWTIDTWVYPRTLVFGLIGGICQKENAGSIGGNYRMSLGSAGNSTFTYYDGGGFERSVSTSVIPLNNWTLATFVRDNTTQYSIAYLNGGFDAQALRTQTPATNSSDLVLGFVNLGVDAYQDGIIDEFRIANVPRSADWIDWVYQNEFDNASTFSLGAEETAGAGGGTTVTATDSISTSESATRTLAALRAASDNPTLSESLARIVTLNRSTSDNPTLSESAAQLVTQQRTTSDNIVVSESVARLLNATRTTTDSPTLSESLNKTLAAVRAANDAISTSESLQTLKALLRVSVDALTTSESLTRTANLSRSTSDSIASSESMATSKSLLRSTSDAVSLSESMARLLNVTRTTADTVTLSDSVIALRGLISRSTTDSLISSESISRIVTLNRLTSDSPTLLESLTAIKSIHFTTTDSVVLSDAATQLSTKNRSTTETITLSESIDADADVHVARTASEAIVLSDTATRNFFGSRSTSNSISLADSATRTQALNRAVSQTITLSEDLFATLGGSIDRPIVDSVSLSEVAAIVFNLGRATFETITLADVAVFEVPTFTAGVSLSNLVTALVLDGSPVSTVELNSSVTSMELSL